MQSWSSACLDPEISILSARQSNLKFNHLSPKRECLIIIFFEKKTGADINLGNLGVEGEGGGVSGDGSLAALLGFSLGQSL